MSAPATLPARGAHSAELARRPAEERGRLVIDDRVVEKIAEAAAAEVTDVAALTPRLAERVPGRTARRARARAVVDGRLVQLRVTAAVTYPVSLRTVTREMRAHVRDTVSRLCDVEVRAVDIDVDVLRRDRDERRVQ